jgi:hypothetical protein
MRVYYMTSTEVALKHILPEQRLKVSRFKDLNDPFELGCHDAGDRRARQRTQAFIQTTNEKLGLICFSDNWKSPVMWAHYANKHEGVCIGFDIHENYLGYVQYTSSRLGFSMSAKLKNSIQFIDEMLYHKAQEWSYENELRAVVLLDGPKHPISHIPFGTAIQMREIVLGARCVCSPLEMAEFVLPQQTSVTITKARPAFKTFEMTVNKKFKPVTIAASRDCRRLHGQQSRAPRFLLRTPQEGEC